MKYYVSIPGTNFIRIVDADSRTEAACKNVTVWTDEEWNGVVDIDNITFIGEIRGNDGKK